MKQLVVNIDQGDLHARLALFHERNGNLEQAESHVQRALQKDGKNAIARLAQGRLRRRQGRLPEAAKVLRALAEELGGSNPLSASIHFDLAEVCDRLGEYRQALSNWIRANTLQANHPDNQEVNKNAFLVQIERQRRHDYTRLKLPKPDQHSKSPIFLVGFPRSGTTLLHHMLADHPEIFVMEEIPIIHRIARDLGNAQGGYPSALDKLNTQECRNLRDRYFREVMEHQEVEREKQLVDKLPLSMIHVPLLKLLFPDCKIVLLLRHPCDCVFSNFAQQYTLNDAMANFSNLDDAANAYYSVFDLWNHYSEQFAFDYHALKYEELVTDVDTVQRRLLDYLDLPWPGSVLQHQVAAQDKFIRTPSYHDVRQSLYTRSIGRWRNYQKLLDWPPGKLTPFIEQFGYDKAG